MSDLVASKEMLKNDSLLKPDRPVEDHIGDDDDLFGFGSGSSNEMKKKHSPARDMMAAKLLIQVIMKWRKYK